MSVLLKNIRLKNQIPKLVKNSLKNIKIKAYSTERVAKNDQSSGQQQHFWLKCNVSRKKVRISQNLHIIAMLVIYFHYTLTPIKSNKTDVNKMTKIVRLNLPTFHTYTHSYMYIIHNCIYFSFTKMVTWSSRTSSNQKKSQNSWMPAKSFLTRCPSKKIALFSAQLIRNPRKIRINIF